MSGERATIADIAREAGVSASTASVVFSGKAGVSVEASRRWAADLLTRSEEFREVWATHEVGLRPGPVKRFIHPQVGLLELQCQTLSDPQQAHSLLVYTAEPGSETHEKLQLLSVIGGQAMI